MAANIQELFEEKWKTAVDSASRLDSWKAYLTMGAGERAIAGSHQGRYVLELLQNARDAIYRKDDVGKVLVIVNNQGVAVANSGAPFGLDERNILDALCFQDRSSKTEDSGFIGHKGIGMKSILLRARAFSIRTWLAGDQELVHADFSRLKTAQKLLEEWKYRIPEEMTQLVAELPRLALFNPPHLHKGNSSTLFDEIVIDPDLLAHLNISELVTVIWLLFEDREDVTWDSIRQKYLNDFPNDNLEKAFDQKRSEVENLTPSTDQPSVIVWEDLQRVDECALILMGHLRTVTFVKLDNQGKLSDSIHYAIEREHLPTDGGVFMQKVTVVKKTFKPQNVETHVYYQLQESEGDPLQKDSSTEASILLPLPGANQGIAYDHKLYMYYPIDKEPTGLPFIIHGRFKVSSDRTMLWEEAFAHNHKVISRGLDLLKKCIPILTGLDDVRDWLPWILMPVDLSGDDDKNKKIKSSWIHEEVRLLIKNSNCVPAQDFTAIFPPAAIHFLPVCPNAFRDFYSETYKSLQTYNLRLPREKTLENYEKLGNKTQVTEAAYKIGLGEFNIQEVVDWLIAHGKQYQASSSSKEALLAKHAVDFFAGICTLLAAEAKKDEKHAKDLAEALGKAGVPILPVLLSDMSVGLAPARTRGSQDDEGWKRVVFLPPDKASGLDMLKQGQPVQGITIYFMPDDLENIKVAQLYSAEWGLEKFTDRADFFRSISERMDELSDVSDEPKILAALGYLASLLSQISGEPADDLRPRPYAFINIESLKAALAGKPVERERLRRAQGWRRIKVPTQDSGLQEVRNVYFGLEWTNVLSGAENDDQAQAWRFALEANNSLQRNYPNREHEIALIGPDDLRWQNALFQMDKSATGEIKEDPKYSLFKLLLLLGVRIGPRLEWRWFGRSGNDESDNAVGSNDFGKDTRIPNIPEQLIDDDLLGNYAKYIKIKDYNPAFTIEFNRHCSDHKWRRRGAVTGLHPTDFLAALIWFPDLAKSSGFNDNIIFCDAFCLSVKAILAIQLDNNHNSKENSFLWTGWFSNYSNYQQVWNFKIPSLAHYQLSHLPLWKSSNLSSDLRFPACAMLAVPPGSNLAGKFLPLYVTSESDQAMAEQLGIFEFEKLISSPTATIERYVWLINSFRKAGESPVVGLLQIDIGNNDRSEWQMLLLELLRNVAKPNPDNWDRHLLASLGFMARVLKHNLIDEWAVPYLFEAQKGRFQVEINFYDHAPRSWEIKANSDKYFLLTDRTLDNKLQPWALEIGVVPLHSKDPENNLATLLTSETAEKYRKELIQEVLENRLDLILGTLQGLTSKEKDQGVQAVKISNLVSQLQIVEGPLNSQPLGKDNVLLAPLREKPQPADLAFGLAVLLGQVASLDSIYLTLSAPREIVEELLEQKGVNLKELVGEVAELRIYHEKNRARELARCFKILFNDLGIIWNNLDDESLDQVGNYARAQWIEKFPQAPTEQIDQIYKCFEAEAKDDILNANKLLGILRSMNAGDLTKVRFTNLFPGMVAVQEEKARDLIIALVVINHLQDEQDITNLADLKVEVIHRKEKYKKLLAEDQDVFKSELKIILLDNPVIPSSYMFEWSDADWARITDACYRFALLEIDDHKNVSDIRNFLRKCLEMKTLEPEQEDKSTQESVEHLIEKNLLLQGFLSGNLFAGMTLSKAADVSFMNLAQNPDENRGDSPTLPSDPIILDDGVSLGQELRGRRAELFVIERIWRRYLEITTDKRKVILSAIRTSRTSDPIRGGKTSGDFVSKKLLENQELLINVNRDNPEPGLKELFHDAVYLGEIGLAGFDVLDPFSSGQFDQGIEPQPEWVEVKGIQPGGGLVYLTTHEFHTARRNPDRYRLRAVVIPIGGEKDIAAYTLLMDLKPGSDDKAKFEQALVGTVFGGKLQFLLKQDTPKQE